MAGKSKRLKRAELFPYPGELHRRRDQIGYVGPFMHDIERPRIGDDATLRVLGDDEVEPRSPPGAEEIARAQDDRAHAALGSLAHALLDRHPDVALPG